MGSVELKEFTRTGFDAANRVEETEQVADWPLGKTPRREEYFVLGYTPVLLAKSAQAIGKMGDKFCKIERRRKSEARAQERRA